MFLIQRLWIDSMENRDAYGFKPIGTVESDKEAERMVALEHIPKSKYPWPLNYAYEFKGDTVPVFIAKELPDLTGFSLEQLKNV